jgi:hypothetical protein
MLLSRRTKAGLASVALVGTLGAAALIAGGSMNSAADAELSSAEIVALRFPEELVDAASPAAAAPDAAADRAVQQTLSILAFNPDPLGVPGPRSWASRQALEPVSAHPDPAAATAAGERTGSIAAAPAGRLAPAPRAKHQPATLFNDAQIASIKERLNLSRDQERYWPSVESALRYIGWRHSRERPGADPPTLDPDDVERVKYAAMPLIMSLREDQKREVRMLAHVMGLEKIAAQF